MVIRQGDVFWLDLGDPSGSAPGYRHPHVVVQNDVFNASRIATTVVCAMTTNPKRTHDPGNVLLLQGEANLPKQCVVNVSQVATVDKEDLTEKIGTLSPVRLQDVLHGLYLLLEPSELPDK
jgi:mRNA interferase MazF